MKRIKLVIITVLLLFTLTACNLEGVNDKDNYEVVSVTHKVSKFEKMDGETAIYKKVEVTEDFYVNPKNVVTFSWGVADTFDYFGLDKVGIEKLGLPTETSNIPNIIKGLNNIDYIDAGTLHIINYDTIDLLNPDLIILDGRTASQYEHIKEKYPNINVLDASSTNYSLEQQKSIFNNLGKIFQNIKEELDEVIIEFELAFTEISAKAKTFNAMFLMLNGTKLSDFSHEESRYGTLFNEFGFLVAKLANSTEITGSHGREIGFEAIDEINPQVIFIMDRASVVEGSSSDKTFLKDPTLSNVSAIKNDLVFDLNAEAWYTVTGGISATKQMIKDVKAFIQ